MAHCCDKNPLQRSGINQEHRWLAGLRPGYINIDEREYEDWIFFAEEFAAYLNYYDAGNILTGNWKTFFSYDISAILGSIAIQNVNVYRSAIKERFDYIKDDANKGDLNAIKQKLNELFSAALSLSKSIDDYFLKLPDKDLEEKDFVFKITIQNLIKTKLSPLLWQLLSYYFAIDGDPAGEPDYLNTSNIEGWKIFNREVSDAAVIIDKKNGLSQYWWQNGVADWEANINLIKTAPDNSVFGPVAWTEYDRILHAVNHNLFYAIFDQYLQAYTQIVKDAEKYLLQTLEKWNVHPAHYALFLAFLKLFRVAQTHINTLTGRHLDFYYKDILHLFPKEAQPNHSHLVLQLAKQTNEYALKKDVAFKAGKDSEGKEVSYGLDKETTFNKAKVALLKSVYQGKRNGKDDHKIPRDPANTITDNSGRLFVSPITNSDDGIGGELASANKEWHPYTNKKFINGILTDVAMQNAQIGFAIASHYLYLTEGERVVYIKLVTSNNALLVGKSIECYLTTDKGWLKIAADTSTQLSAIATGTTSETPAAGCAQFTITLHGDAPAITNYNSKIHGGTLNVDVPVLKVILVNDDKSAYQYEELKNILVTKTEIKVEAGGQTGFSQTGLKQLSLSNNFGPIDASKPFLPFGALPKIDTTFVVGNKEVFSKKNLNLNLNIEWAGLLNYPGDLIYRGPTFIQLNMPFLFEMRELGGFEIFGEEMEIDLGNNIAVNVPIASGGISGGASSTSLGPDVNIDLLKKGIWQPHSTTSLFDTSGSVKKEKMIPVSGIDELSLADYKSIYDNYDASDRSGFLRLVLATDLGFKKYQDELVTYLINKARNIPDSNNPKPNEPYTPTIQSLYLSYSANTIHDLTQNNKKEFDKRETQFFHLYPFGEGEQHSYITDNNTLYLLPQFIQPTTNESFAEFYIGLENLKRKQSVNILFQFMEGSSDPLIDKPKKHVHWFYLARNKWIEFKDQEITDTTRQMVQSGIISFIIPADATTNNTILPSEYLWIKAAVPGAAEAVCKLITVDAQVAYVTFSPNNNAQDFLNMPLPAETISKLKEPDSSVKKIVQPYSSFGGRAKENNDNYYVRVSERLRHKARAITIWDYEHIVLEAFPSIYRVKCLNHTKFEKNETSGKVEYNEAAPGYVTIITVPNLQNRNDTNPLRPFTNQNLLSEIKEYLGRKISCHVKLNVKNPRFEEIWLSFKLKLLKGFDDFSFYEKQLREEITRFLSPWATNSKTDVQFGGKIHKSIIIDFIEERPYVDFITDVKMFHDTNPDHEDAGDCDEENVKPGQSGDLDIIEASTARSILVSAPASKHTIEQITDTIENKKEDCPGLFKPVNVIG